MILTLTQQNPWWKRAPYRNQCLKCSKATTTFSVQCNSQRQRGKTVDTRNVVRRHQCGKTVDTRNVV
jgi:hypothetical protein